MKRRSKRKGAVRALFAAAAATTAFFAARSAARRIRRNRRKRILKTIARVLLKIAAIPAAAALFQLTVRYLRKLRGGYLFDVFDSGRFSIARRGEEKEAGEKLDREQEASDRPEFRKPENAARIQVPKDEDADEFNLG